MLNSMQIIAVRVYIILPPLIKNTYENDKRSNLSFPGA